MIQTITSKNALLKIVTSVFLMSVLQITTVASTYQQDENDELTEQTQGILDKEIIEETIMESGIPMSEIRHGHLPDQVTEDSIAINQSDILEETEQESGISMSDIDNNKQKLSNIKPCSKITC